MNIGLILGLVLGHVGASAPQWKVVEVHQTAVFAGKLGDRVHERLTIELDGERRDIDVVGDYHTHCTRPWQRIHEGDAIRIAPGAKSILRWTLD